MSGMLKPEPLPALKTSSRCSHHDVVARCERFEVGEVAQLLVHWTTERGDLIENRVVDVGWAVATGDRVDARAHQGFGRLHHAILDVGPDEISPPIDERIGAPGRARKQLGTLRECRHAVVDCFDVNGACASMLRAHVEVDTGARWELNAIEVFEVLAYVFSSEELFVGQLPVDQVVHLQRGSSVRVERGPSDIGVPDQDLARDRIAAERGDAEEPRAGLVDVAEGFEAGVPTFLTRKAISAATVGRDGGLVARVDAQLEDTFASDMPCIEASVQVRVREVGAVEVRLSAFGKVDVTVAGGCRRRALWHRPVSRTGRNGPDR